jgi:AcrR family transcriptional regulator
LHGIGLERSHFGCLAIETATLNLLITDRAQYGTNRFNIITKTELRYRGHNMAVKTEAKRQAILKVAEKAFQELGFERTSMSEICSRVGGSKATIYNYFASKEELFFEIIHHSIQAEFDAAYAAIDPSADDIAQSLRNYGENFLSILYTPQVRANRHLAISESGRTALGRIVYERGVLDNQRLVSDVLRTAMSLGKLRPADPALAAKHLISLLETELLDRFLFQVLGEVSSEEIREIAARGIDAFMSIYGKRSS